MVTPATTGCRKGIKKERTKENIEKVRPLVRITGSMAHGRKRDFNFGRERFVTKLSSFLCDLMYVCESDVSY
jgi:hypothetical protein